MKKPGLINEPKERLSVTLEEHVKLNQGIDKSILSGEINASSPSQATANH